MAITMKDLQKGVQTSITDLKKQYRKALKEERFGEAKRLDDEIDELEDKKAFYAASVKPVRFENGLVVNGALLKKFAQKAKRLEVIAVVSDDLIKLEYNRGECVLLDQREKYKVLKLPSGEELLDEIGIYLS